MKHSKTQTTDEITIVECGPREWSLLDNSISSLDKVQFIKSLAETGLKKIDYAAFSHPHLYPGSADTEIVTQALEKKENIIYSALVPNEIACRRALATAVDEVATFIAASEDFCQIAMGQGIREMLNKTLPAIFGAASVGGKIIRTKILGAFGCPYSGTVPLQEICNLVSRLAKLGTSEVCLVDNTGLSNPIHVRQTVNTLMKMGLGVTLAVHFHDNRGTGIANCVAAYEAGIRVFDTSVGGVCGFPLDIHRQDNVSWNIPTEDLVHLFEEMNIRTGVNLNLLLKCVKTIGELSGQKLNGHILRAGLSSELIPVGRSRTLF